MRNFEGMPVQIHQIGVDCEIGMSHLNEFQALAYSQSFKLVDSVCDLTSLTGNGKRPMPLSTHLPEAKQYKVLFLPSTAVSRSLGVTNQAGRVEFSESIIRKKNVRNSYPDLPLSHVAL